MLLVRSRIGHPPSHLSAARVGEASNPGPSRFDIGDDDEDGDSDRGWPADDVGDRVVSWRPQSASYQAMVPPLRDCYPHVRDDVVHSWVEAENSIGVKYGMAGRKETAAQVRPPVGPTPDGRFTPAKAYYGWFEGFIYKTDDDGTGYYRDDGTTAEYTAPTASASAPRTVFSTKRATSDHRRGG